MTSGPELFRTVAGLALADPEAARRLPEAQVRLTALPRLTRRVAAGRGVRFRPPGRSAPMPYSIDLLERPEEPAWPPGESRPAPRFRTATGGVLSTDGARVDGDVVHAEETLPGEVE